jgi:hypothetical protein
MLARTVNVPAKIFNAGHQFALYGITYKIVNMEEASTSKTSVAICHTTQDKIPEAHSPNFDQSVNIVPHISKAFFCIC